MFQRQIQAAIRYLVVVAALLPRPVLSQSTDASNFSDTVFEGVLEPIRKVDVAASEFGILRELYVKPGTFVRANDPIAKLDTRELESQLVIAVAEYESRGKLSQVESEMALQVQKLGMLRDLHENSNANLQEVQRAESDLEIVKARLQAEKESIEVLRLQAERLRKVLELYQIRAPIDGVVVELQRNIGEFVSASSPSIVRIHDVSQLKATFPMTEQEIVGLLEASEMSIRLSDGRVVAGKVDFIPPVADPQSGWFMVTVVIDNADGSIRCSRCARVK